MKSTFPNPSLPAALLAWFDQLQIQLPWRGSRDPYRIWLSEIMLQQTRIAAVESYYMRFLERFPTIEALAAAPLFASLVAPNPQPRNCYTAHGHKLNFSSTRVTPKTHEENR